MNAIATNPKEAETLITVSWNAVGRKGNKQSDAIPEAMMMCLALFDAAKPCAAPIQKLYSVIAITAIAA